MSQITVPRQGLAKNASNMLKAAIVPDEALVMGLYVNDVTPTITSVPGDFTLAQFTGWQPAILYRGQWSEPVASGDEVVMQYGTSPITVFNGGADPVTIRGVILVGGTSGLLFFARRFDTPLVLAYGQTSGILPRVRLKAVSVPIP